MKELNPYDLKPLEVYMVPEKRNQNRKSQRHMNCTKKINQIKKEQDSMTH